MTGNRPTMFLGLDPGLSGGIAFYYPPGITVTAMPDTERDVWGWIDRLRDHRGSLFAVIEKVHAMPGNGVSSMFKFGVGYGGLRMALVAAGIPFEEVTPQTWMKVLRIPPRKKTEDKTKWKNRLKQVAQNLHPNEPITLKTCDAILIATYAQRKYGGTT